MSELPRFGRALARLLCPKDRREEIEGDLEEMFQRRVERVGRGAARKLYYRDLVSLCRPLGARAAPGASRPGGGNTHALFQNLRFGLRSLAQNRSFTVVSIVTLALGIGANSAIFTLLDATLLRKPQGEAPERVLSVYTEREGRLLRSSYPDYVDIRDATELFAGFAASSSIAVTWSSEEGSELLHGFIVSGSYFSVLGLRPVVGRFFVPEDDEPGSQPVAVLSHRLWTERFAGAPDVIGSTMRLNGRELTIVGVAPRGFNGRNLVEAGDVWVPMVMQAVVRPPRAGFYGGMDPDLLERRAARWLDMFGRLRPGAEPEQAAASLAVMSRRLADAYPDSNESARFTALPASLGDPRFREELVPVATLSMAVVGLVLLIACANVANLQLARAAARRVETATRAALGASRGRLVQQFLIESILVASAGAVAGVVVAAWGTGLLVSTLVEAEVLPIPLTIGVFPSARVLGFTLVVAFATALIFGLTPAVQAAREDLTDALRDGAVRRSFTSRKALVVAQVAMSMLLMVSTALFLESLDNASAIDPGFDTENMLVIEVPVNLLSYSKEQGRQFYERLIEETEAIPGVDSAALARVTALGGGRRLGIVIDGNTTAGGDDPAIVGANVVSPGYLDTLGIALMGGRRFTRADRDGAPPVCIVNETMALRFWPAESPLGKRLRIGGPESATIEVVGIARDSKYFSLGEAPTPFMYLPLLQNHETGVTLHVRADADAMGLAQPIRERIRSLEPNLPTDSVRPMSQQLATELFPARVGAILIALFGLVALLLASVGVYGVMSCSVEQRSHELGIRMALGARASHVFGIVLKETFVLVGMGVSFGLITALVLARPVESFLYHVDGRDPLTYVGAMAVLLAASLVAVVVPARRATEVDPVTAVRCR